MRLKIILHMGQAKTGTTSLQRSLRAAAGSLREQGVFYPQLGNGYVAHHLLLGICGAADRLPKWDLDNMGGLEGTIKTAQRAWDTVRKEIDEQRPEIMVLSSEYLLGKPKADAKERLRDQLSELSDDITPVIYVRHPVEHFRSLFQQFVKHVDGPFPPVRLDLRSAILETEAAFGRTVELATFDRSVLHQGDIAKDFATRFLAGRVDPSILPSMNDNVSLSAEALALIVRLRAKAGGTYEAARSVSRLVARIQELDRNDPPAKPMDLLPEVAEAALRAATGHRWLAETRQLHIPRLEIEKIDGAPPPDWMMTAPPTALFNHDPERLERLQRALDQRLSKTAQPRNDSAAAAPRFQDFLLRFLLGKLGSR